MHSSDTSNMNQQAASRFCSLPPELRNHIYDLLVENQKSEVDFADADPPTKAILLSCKKICHEAKGIVSLGIRSFWENTTFRFSCSASDDRILFTSSEAQNIQHINNIDIAVSGARLTLGRSSDVVFPWLVDVTTEDHGWRGFALCTDNTRLGAMKKAIKFREEAAERRADLVEQRQALGARLEKEESAEGIEELVSLIREGKQLAASAKVTKSEMSARDLEVILYFCCWKARDDLRSEEE